MQHRPWTVGSGQPDIERVDLVQNPAHGPCHTSEFTSGSVLVDPTAFEIVMYGASSCGVIVDLPVRQGRARTISGDLEPLLHHHAASASLASRNSIASSAICATLLSSRGALARTFPMWTTRTLLRSDGVGAGSPHGLHDDVFVGSKTARCDCGERYRSRPQRRHGPPKLIAHAGKRCLNELDFARSTPRFSRYTIAP